MVTNVGLPLLIVKGKFKSLEFMTIDDLETFIPFLVKCSINRAGATLVNDRPEWWDSSVPFRFPLLKPRGLSMQGYRRHLSAIVCQCYYYHDAQFLLPFCGKIAKRPQLVLLKSNPDDTTSVFYVKNSLHILTFNNENRNYDMETEEGGEGEEGDGEELRARHGARRCLLQQPPPPSGRSNPLTVYLCENCDLEFSSCRDMEQHELECNPGEPSAPLAALDSEGEDAVEVSKPTEQNVFLQAMQLMPRTQPGGGSSPPATPSRPRRPAPDSPSKRWVNVDMCLHKNRSVEFSSYYGARMLGRGARRDLAQHRPEKLVWAYESYCHTSSRAPAGGARAIELRTRYRAGRKLTDDWTHTLSFTARQRAERYRTLKTGLNAPSRRLLRRCRPCHVQLTRLPRVIERPISRTVKVEWPSNAPAEPIVIDLTDAVD